MKEGLTQRREDAKIGSGWGDAIPGLPEYFAFWHLQRSGREVHGMASQIVKVIFSPCLARMTVKCRGIKSGSAQRIEPRP